MGHFVPDANALPVVDFRRFRMETPRCFGSTFWHVSALGMPRDLLQTVPIWCQGGALLDAHALPVVDFKRFRMETPRCFGSTFWHVSALNMTQDLLQTVTR